MQKLILMYGILPSNSGTAQLAKVDAEFAVRTL